MILIYNVKHQIKRSQRMIKLVIKFSFDQNIKYFFNDTGPFRRDAIPHVCFDFPIIRRDAIPHVYF